MIVEIREEVYKSLVQCLAEKFPEVEVKLLQRDTNLKDLGFVDYVPCTVEICVTDEQIDEICNYALDLGDMVFNDDRLEDSSAYQEFMKYEWLYDFFALESFILKNEDQEPEEKSKNAI